MSRMFNSEQLFTMADRILQAAGARAEESRVVAGELRDANLVGHDSHGVMRLMQYVEHIEQNYIRPGGQFEIVVDEPSICVIDGHFNFGQVIASQALEIGIEKARAGGAATVMIRNCNHVGRLGSYADKAARTGLAAMMAVNAPGPGGVAPYGGMDRRLGTNPVSLAAPRGDFPLVLDMTTSATAEGKLRVAHQKGESVGEGLVIDGQGRPTTNPGDFYNGDPPGAILPLGGAMGFKGFGLSVMVDIFAGILSGSGICRTDLPRGANGVWMSFLDVDKFLPRSEYDALVETYCAYLKSSRRLPGIDEILLPGEIELRRQADRVQNGVPVPDETWRQIGELATRLGTRVDDL